jgi:hypothetical protein
MSLPKRVGISVLCVGVVLAGTRVGRAQAGAESYTATAAVKTAGSAAANAPVKITVTHKMPQTEADKFIAAYKTGGAAALRKALVGVPPTGSIQIGDGKAVPTRLTLERPTDKGHLITIVTDQPLLFLGAGVPGAKAKEGYDFGVVDLEVDASGSGAGSISPAAKITLKQGVFVVEDYAAELVRLTAVKKTK